jgi:hypothetical protein
MARETIFRPDGPLPPSGLGPDGKIIHMNEEERRAWCEAACRRLSEIAGMTDPEGEPSDSMERMMRGIDEGRPHRPLFKGLY